MSEEQAAEGGAAPAEAPATSSDATNAGTTEPTTPAPSDWTGQLPDDLKGYVANKGWDSPVKVAQSYRELEKFAGSKANYVEIPDPSDADAVKGIMQRLGTPKDLDGYKIDLGEDVQLDDKFANSFKEFALSQNLTASQVQASAEWFEGFNKTAQGEAATTNQQQAEQAIAALKTEWGNDFNSNVAAGQNLVRAVGISTDELAALEGQFDTPTVMNLMAKLGARLGDNALVGEDAGGNSGFAMTPQQAQAKIGQLGADPEFRKRMYDHSNPGHKSAVSELDRLQQIASNA